MEALTANCDACGLIKKVTDLEFRGTIDTDRNLIGITMNCGHKIVINSAMRVSLSRDMYEERKVRSKEEIRKDLLQREISKFDDGVKLAFIEVITDIRNILDSIKISMLIKK